MSTQNLSSNHDNERIYKLLENVNTTLESMKTAMSSIYKETVHCREEVKVIKKYLHKSGNHETLTSSQLPPLPIQTLETLQTIEQILDIDDERKCLIRKLSIIGGNQPRAVVNNIMNALLSREVAIHFSLHGRTNKKAFKDLKIYLCVLGEHL